MTIDPHKYAKKKRTMGQRSIYVDVNVFDEFSRLCDRMYGGRAAGDVLSDILTDFLEAAKETPAESGAAIRPLIELLGRVNERDLPAAEAFLRKLAGEPAEVRAKAHKLK